MMKTEKRKANVGERILITDKHGHTMRDMTVGSTYEVIEDGLGNYVEVIDDKGDQASALGGHYEVIVCDKPKKSARITALETQVAELQAKVEALESAGKYPLTERFEREFAEVDAILADIKRKANRCQSW